MAEEEKLQLLVVEDDEDDYFLIRRLLQSGLKNAEVERASTVDDALQRTAHNPYDLFLLDYRLGEKSGLELLRELKKAPGCRLQAAGENRLSTASGPEPGTWSLEPCEPDLGLAAEPPAPVIFLTGQGDERVAVEAMKAGATDYLPKSRLSAPALNTAVRYAINLRHKEEAVRAARRALHASERRFRALVENSTDVVVLLDAQATILYVSQSVRRILGFSPEELVESCGFDYVHPDDLSAVKELFNLALQSPGVPLRGEYRLRANAATPGSGARLQAASTEPPSLQPAARSLEPASVRSADHPAWPDPERREGEGITRSPDSWRILEATMMNRLRDPAVAAVVVNGRDITDRRRAELAQRLSEREYRTLFENANDAIMIFEPESEVILEANPQACLLYGFTHEELVGTSLKQISHDAEPGRQAISRLLATGSFKDFETLHYRKDGSPLCILANASLIQYRGRQAVLSLSRDISERKLADKDRRKLHSAVEQSADVVVITDREGVIEYVNPAFERLTGYSRDEAVGSTPRLLKSGKHEPSFYAQLWATIIHGEVFRDVVINRKKNGELYYSEKTITPVLDEGGQISHFISNDRDITERILGERERLLAEEELRASEHQYRMLVETASEGIWTIDAEDRTTFVNAKMAAMLGYEPREMLARPLFDFLLETSKAQYTPVTSADRVIGSSGDREAPAVRSPDHPITRSPDSQPWLQRLRAGRPQQVDTVLRRKDGSELFVILSSSPICDREGNYAGTLAMITDITERRTLEEQLRHSQKLDAVGQLAGGVAHDFNNLLMVISSYAELLSDSVQHDPKALRETEQILKAARRAAGLTRQLLAFSRKQVLAPRVLDLNTVLADFGRMLPRLIGEDIEVVVKPGKDLWKVKVDPVQIEQVLMNLAVNARDAMTGSPARPELACRGVGMTGSPVSPTSGLPGCQDARLTLETANITLDEDYARRHAGVSPGNYVMTAVTDTGTGIPADILPHIFEPFFTTKAQGKGTGLGLPTVYGIVKQSGGFVWVYSELGRGTVFKLYLPRADESLADSPSFFAASANDQRPRTNDGSEAILLVEDEEAVREPAGEFLTLRGYTVLQAKNGSDALQVLEHYVGTVELLVTDVIMPGMSGRELAARIAEVRPGMRVLYISGYTQDTVERHGIGPASHFLQKPFSLSALGRKVREVLEDRDEASGSRLQVG